MKKFWRWKVVIVAPQYAYINVTELYTRNGENGKFYDLYNHSKN